MAVRIVVGGGVGGLIRCGFDPVWRRTQERDEAEETDAHAIAEKHDDLLAHFSEGEIFDLCVTRLHRCPNPCTHAVLTHAACYVFPRAFAGGIAA
eukprot:2110518-Pleurochrysis_carterae.AAC.1